jgi:excinuclease ABC subunit C
VSALDELGLEGQRVASIAKKEEVLFVRGNTGAGIALPKDSPVLHLIQRMRDEAHRFAVTYHRKRRELRDFDSELMQVPGIGETRKKVLLRAFGSLDRVKAASFEELAPYVGPKAASSIVKFFRPTGKYSV